MMKMKRFQLSRLAQRKMWEKSGGLWGEDPWEDPWRSLRLAIIVNDWTEKYFVQMKVSGKTIFAKRNEKFN